MQIKTMRYLYTPIRVVKIQNPEHWQYQMLVRIWSNRNSHLLPVGIQNGTATLEDSLVVSTKLKVFLPYNPAIAHHGISLKELKTWST